jgi:hypothetical protein
MFVVAEKSPPGTWQRFSKKGQELFIKIKDKLLKNFKTALSVCVVLVIGKFSFFDIVSNFGFRASDL